MPLLKHRCAALAALGIASCGLLLLPAAGEATTGLEETVPVQVTMTDAGVKFSVKIKANTDMTLQMRITNRGTKRRWFRIGERQTHALRKGQSEFVYFSFHVPGKVAWRSRAVGGTPFAGAFKVEPADRFGIPQG